MLTAPQLLNRREVAALFGVAPRTITRWATSGRLTPLRTPGGHFRFRADEVDALRTGAGTGEGCPPAGEGGDT
jgi:excisionase family DNA binding protein